MPNTIAPDLYKQLLGVKPIIEQDIRGTEGLDAGEISAELHAEYRQGLDSLDEFLRLIQQLLDQLDAAQATYDQLIELGFPVPPSFTIPAALQEEFMKQLRDLTAGAGVFGGGATPPLPASNLSVSLGQPIPKEPVPASDNRRK